MKKLLLLIFPLLIACNDANYHAENYQAFGSMDELVHEITASIQNQDEAKMLKLLDNEKLLLDLLNSAEGEDANKTKAYMMTDAGKRSFNNEQMSKKQRMNAFFTTGLKSQITINKTAFKMVGYTLDAQAHYSENSPAQLQDYTIVFDNGEDKPYKYHIKVVYWDHYYHLIEANGYFEF